MIREWWTDQGLFLAPVTALAIFMILFLGVLFWIFRPGSKRIYEQKARMPLEDQTPDHKTV